ncbi:hypothetical protein BaRGS_00003513 [Batillaria attramentaria]|uniref:Uncharacterized protein n=1 Tax=Batillaria attramentaria TaxID=370345 RepID=A0ABD0M232_9CAEN
MESSQRALTCNPTTNLGRALTILVTKRLSARHSVRLQQKRSPGTAIYQVDAAADYPPIPLPCVGIFPLHRVPIALGNSRLS